MSKGSRYIWLLIISCLAIPVIAQKQVTDQQIENWIKALSVKYDFHNEKFKQVLEDLSALDSAVLCPTLDIIRKKSLSGNVECQIRTKYLEYFKSCPGAPDKIIILKEALQMAYEIEDEVLEYDLHLTLGQLYNSIAQYGLASLHFRQYFDILQHHNRAELSLPSGAFYDMSYSLYHTHEFRDCITVGLNALRALPNARFQPDDSLNDYQKMLQWNTIGLSYHKIEKYDSAFLAFRESYKMADQLSSKFWMGIVKGNIGDVYFEQGQYDSAYTLLAFDYHQSIIDRQYDNAANSLQWIARIDVEKGKTREAGEKLYTAQRHLQLMPQPTYQANLYYAFSQLYTRLGRADSVNMYLQKYLHLHDSLEAQVTKSRTDVLQFQLNNLNQVQTIKNLNREKRQITHTRNYSIVLVILLACLGYMGLNRARLKMQIRQRTAQEGQRLAEAETKRATELLDTFRQHLVEKNMLIEKMQTDVLSKDNAEDHTRRLSELANHLILTDEDWTRFKSLFDSVYPAFFLSLRNKVPDITQSEQRMAALSKLKLTAKEAANLLGVSPNTIYTTKRRLRQRLGLENDAELDPFLEIIRE